MTEPTKKELKYLFSRRDKAMQPVKKVSSTLTEMIKEEKPEHGFLIRPILDGEWTEIYYRKFELQDKGEKIPTSLRYVENKGDFFKRKTFVEKKPKHLFVEGYYCQYRGKEIYVACDMYRNNDDNSEPEYLEGINSHLMRGLLYARGFIVFPHWLTAPGDKLKKTGYNKKVAEYLMKQAKRQRWPAIGVEVINVNTRESKQIL